MKSTKKKPYRFPKGNKLGGNRKTPPEIKAARKLNAIESFKIVNQYAWMSPNQLKTLKELSADLPLYEQGIINSFVSFAKSGNVDHIKFWVEHLIGKPKERVEHSGTIENPVDLSGLTTAQLKRLARFGGNK